MGPQLVVSESWRWQGLVTMGLCQDQGVPGPRGHQGPSRTPLLRSACQPPWHLACPECRMCPQAGPKPLLPGFCWSMALEHLLGDQGIAVETRDCGEKDLQLGLWGEGPAAGILGRRTCSSSSNEANTWHLDEAVDPHTSLQSLSLPAPSPAMSPTGQGVMRM